MTSIRFEYQGVPRELPGGELFRLANAEGFIDTPASDLRQIITAVESGEPWREVVESRYRQENPWLADIVTSPLRTSFFTDLLPTTPGVALDIGGGWGQISRPLASSGWQVAALEPGRERLDFIRASARQDEIDQRICFFNTNYFETRFQTRFDLCLCIGVLEWVGAFQDNDDPLALQRRFLRKVREELTDGGTFILGIENRTGLKYLLGCPDDHIGVTGIALLPGALARRRYREEHGQELKSFTYTDAELTALLREAGFTAIEFFAALPDYKLPQTVVSLQDNGGAFNRGMLSGELFRPEHNGYNGQRLSVAEQDSLQGTYASLAMQGIAHHFAPSFFVRAS